MQRAVIAALVVQLAKRDAELAGYRSKPASMLEAVLPLPEDYAVSSNEQLVKPKAASTSLAEPAAQLDGVKDLAACTFSPRGLHFEPSTPAKPQQSIRTLRQHSPCANATEKDAEAQHDVARSDGCKRLRLGI
jgi:hypothetical protein